MRCTELTCSTCRISMQASRDHRRLSARHTAAVKPASTAGSRAPTGQRRDESLRHFFATTLMSNGVEPQEVQKALRHANLRITLETYVHWLPKKDRPRGLVGSLLRQADGKSSERPANQDHA
ncbi:tyrosine-type recombinase/integrase [Micromonospora saelicesensis]|uniref:tyrosine-type recombinase/integrase n=1 Tax=Micromonospora saelicesensis TaxID=285676 RepID=UPI003D926DC1